jgi:hypothetical protein
MSDDTCTYCRRVTLPRSGAARRRWGCAILSLISVTALASSCVALQVQGAEGDQRDRVHARNALRTYFRNVRDGDWHRAYQQLDELCSSTEAEYTDFIKEEPRLRSFTLGQPAGPYSNIDGTFVSFPVDLTYANGRHEEFEIEVGIDTDGIGPVDGPGCRSLSSISRD